MKRSVLQRLKPGVPRKVLYFAVALLWGFAGYRVLKLAQQYIYDCPFPLWSAIAAGIIAFIPFFYFVFLKVSRRNKIRIDNLPDRNVCFFAFFGWKSYAILTFMILLGIVVARFNLLPLPVRGIFFIALGSSLYASGIYFLIAGVRNLTE